MKRIIYSAIPVLLAVACTDPNPSFVPGDPGVLDPYCKDHEVWREEISVSADYTDSPAPDSISLHIKSVQILVEIDPALTIEGAAVNTSFFDYESVWYVLVPEEGASEISIQGVLKCTTEDEVFTLTLFLSEDGGEITYSIEYGEAADGGVGDGGV